MPTNTDRADIALQTLLAFAQMTDQEAELDAAPQTVLTDLLANLLHYCHLEGFDFDKALRIAKDHCEAAAHEDEKAVL